MPCLYDHKKCIIMKDIINEQFHSFCLEDKGEVAKCQLLSIEVDTSLQLEPVEEDGTEQVFFEVFRFEPVVLNLELQLVHVLLRIDFAILKIYFVRSLAIDFIYFLLATNWRLTLVFAGSATCLVILALFLLVLDAIDLIFEALDVDTLRSLRLHQEWHLRC